MGNCFSRDIDGYDRRTGKPPGGNGYYYNSPSNGNYNMRYNNYGPPPDMHPLGHRRRRRNRRRGNMAAIAASAGAASVVTSC